MKHTDKPLSRVLAAVDAFDSARRLAWQALLLLLLVSTLLTAASAQAGCKIKQMEIPVRIVDRRPVAILSLNGIEVPMLVDSGAFFSMLSESTALQLKLPLRNLPPGLRIEGYTGPIDAQMTRVAKVGLLRTELNNVEFIVGGNELGAGIMGVLGRNILSAADTEYDLAHGAVRLSFPQGDCDKTNFAYWAGEAPVIETPLERGQHHGDTAIRVQVAVNDKRITAMLDTGAPRTALTLKAARRAGIEEKTLTLRGRVGGAGEGRVKSWTGRIATFELGGEKISNSLLQIDDADSFNQGMLIGLDYFLTHRIYVSRLQRHLYATWNGGPVFASAQQSQSHLDTRYAALPLEVAQDNADALARRGAAALAAGNHLRALEDLNRACELAPQVAANFYTRAQLHLAMRQPRAAVADLDQALNLEPTLAEARLRRAKVRAALGDDPGAQADLKQLDAALPPSSALRADMGHFYANLSQVTEALRQFDLWVDTHQKDARLASILNSRCWLRTRLNLDLQQALRDCKQAVVLDDEAAAHLDSLGWTYLRLADAASAKKAFDAAIKLEALPIALYGRGLAQLRLNDTANGEKDLAAARALKPSIDQDVRKQGFEFADGVARPAVAGS